MGRPRCSPASSESPRRELVEDIHAGSQGNPFYAEELLAARRGPAGRLPSSLREVVLARCAELADAALTWSGSPPPRPAARAGADRRRRRRRACRLAGDPRGDGPSHPQERPRARDDCLPPRDRPRGSSTPTCSRGSGGPSTPRSPARSPPARRRIRPSSPTTGARPATIPPPSGPRSAPASPPPTAYASAEAAEQFAGALTLWDSVAPEDRPAGVDRVDLLGDAAEAARATGDFDGAVAYCREALETLDPMPSRSAPPACTSGSAATGPGTSRGRSRVTRERSSCCPTGPGPTGRGWSATRRSR